MSAFLATISVPASLPVDVEPPETFDTAEAAWWHLYHARCEYERDNPCELCGDTMTHGVYGDCDDDTETGHALGQMARLDRVGAVLGTDPSITEGDDPGLVYAVMEVTA